MKLGSNLAEIEAAHATAIKAVEAEKKKDIENRRKGSTSRPPSMNAEAKPEPLAKDGKPVFGTKTDTTETPGLFDSHATAADTEGSQQETAASPAKRAVEASQPEIAAPAEKSNSQIPAGPDQNHSE